MLEKAVIDRIEEDHAVLIVGEGHAQREVDVLRSELPEGAGEGTWLEVELQGHTIVSAAVDQQEADRRRARIHEKLSHLRGGDYLDQG